MQKIDSWLLPQGIEEVLPEDAKKLEFLRRQLLDVFSSWGYELVIPPVVDYLDSLLTGSGHDLDLQTFKLTDQVSGETLGVRADMTPQVARIDAHNLKRNGPSRLCYVGTILRTLGDGLEKNRSPMQIGAEIYGHSGLESDLEVMRLMLEMLAMSGLQEVHLDLGHVEIFRTLSSQAGLSESQETELFDILQRKARPELVEFIDKTAMPAPCQNALLALPTLNGDRTVLDKARKILAGLSDDIDQALTELESIADQLQPLFPALPFSFDLAELRGYHYHTGIVFAAFIPGFGREVARGGRYDNIGAFFGRARAATGFSSDLRLLARLSQQNDEPNRLIYAPYSLEPDLIEMVRDLRAKGLAVVQQLPGHPDEICELACTDILEKQNDQWVIKPLKDKR
jgi:ATP phosphoribosyltransferase regulatory subunit